MRLATWNVNSLKVRLPHLTEWLAKTQPDIVCLQELKLEDAKFPRAELETAGYQAAFSGQKTYNGVAILARGALADVSAGMPGFADEQKRVIAATVGGVRSVCVYCPNGQAVGSEKYDYKLRWFAALKEYLAAELARYPQLAVAGDFNVAPEDRDVHDPKAWEGQVHVSEPERAAWRALLDLGGKNLLVVGLPDDGLPAQRRPAYRPDPRFGGAGAALHGLHRGQGAAQTRAALRPRARHCRVQWIGNLARCASAQSGQSWVCRLHAGGSAFRMTPST
jgi:exodeoxyribonuclease-3